MPDNVRYDFTTKGPLTDDVFQVIVSAAADDKSETQCEQRESAYSTGKRNITAECINQLINYYCSGNKIDESSLPSDKLTALKINFSAFAENAVVEQEYYLPDNSVVFVVRIYSTGIKNKILNY